MKTRSRSHLGTTVWLAVAAALIAVGTTPSISRAEDGAHGGQTNGTNTGSTIHQPGPAVLAPRTTERYTEPGMTRNPVAFDFDPQGNIYVAEGWRAGTAVLDNRFRPLRRTNGIIDDLQKTSVEDRLKQIDMLIETGHYPPDHFTKDADKVRLLKDTDGDGRADAATIFADGFNDPLDGIASGVLVHDGRVYFTNIPHLWLLEDRDGDGDADETTEGERVSLSYGYGIRWAFYGHDMHGLIKGPDGRIYFTIGDRGYNVTTREGKHLYGPERGAVFRMWPDGSGLEIFHEGLRNPQELAFDNYGNLFTGDNNCDKGDLARFVYLPEGGDSGWRQDVQSLDSGGPWLRERMWEPRPRNGDGTYADDAVQPAWIIPPIANVGRGPSGLAHYPGTGDVFPKNGSFLMCDYPAGVRHVLLEPDGAGFKAVEDSAFIDGGTISDAAWGYDGRLYLADWGGGWKPNPDGHLKTMTNQAAHEQQAELIQEVRSLFTNGFDKLSDEKLIELLGHADQRVRIHAQWEAASRGSVIETIASQILNPDRDELFQLHALWAFGMHMRIVRDAISREDAGPINTQTANQLRMNFDRITWALDSPNPQIRAQTASFLGDYGSGAIIINKQLQQLLNDQNAVVQYHAAIALGKMGATEHITPLLDLLDRNNNEDVYIRHAAVYALALIGDADEIAHYALQRDSAASRLGVVLALRRLDSLDLALFLDDADLPTAAEAARAVYDKRIESAYPALAALLDTLPAERMTEPVMRRVIEANVRLADAESAMRLARLASNADAPDEWRLLALHELDQWSAERNREGVWGSWWPRPKQTMDTVMPALRAHLPAIIEGSDGQLLTQASILMLRHLADTNAEALTALASSAEEPEALRLAAAKKLAESDRAEAVRVAATLAAEDDTPAQLKIDLRGLLLGLDAQAAMTSFLEAVRNGTTPEKQQAVNALAAMHQPEAAQAIRQLVGRLEKGTLPPEVRLETYRATTDHHSVDADVVAAAQRYATKHTIGDEPYIRETVLAGGSVERGQEVFLYHAAAECQRCHNADGSPGVGPGLNNIGMLRDMNYLYEALVNPNTHIAEGYASSVVTLKDGSVKTGRIVKPKSTPAVLVLANSDGVESEVQRDQIDGIPITSAQSMMPTMGDRLSAAELRDVLAYLASLRGGGTSDGSLADTGPHINKPAAGLKHHVWLPSVLMGIFVSLGLLLLVTMLGGKQVTV